MSDKIEEEQHPKVQTVTQQIDKERRNIIIFTVILDRNIHADARSEEWALNLAAHYVKKTWG